MLNENQDSALTVRLMKPSSAVRRVNAPRVNSSLAKGRTSRPGLAKSGKNPRRHGMLALSTVLEDESRPAFTRLLKSYLQRFNPLDDFELACVEELVQITWRLQRLRTVESTMFNELAARKKEISQCGRVAAAFREMSFGTALPLLLRYEASLQRMRKNTLNNLALVRKSPEFNDIDLDSVTYDVVGEDAS